MFQESLCKILRHEKNICDVCTTEGKESRKPKQATCYKILEKVSITECKIERSCLICDLSFKNDVLTENHIKEIHKCRHCNDLFFNNMDEKFKHVKIEHTCKVCRESFSKNDLLDPISKVHECEFCPSMTFKHIRDKDHHQEYIHKKCKACKLVLEDIEQHRKHIHQVHSCGHTFFSYKGRYRLIV